jgi:hypothetical protein
MARAVRAEPVVAAAKMVVELRRRLSTAGMFDLFQRAGGFRFRFSSEPDGDPAAPWGSGRTCTGPVRHCSNTCVDRTLYSRDCEGRFNQLAGPAVPNAGLAVVPLRITAGEVAFGDASLQVKGGLAVV